MRVPCIRSLSRGQEALGMNPQSRKGQHLQLPGAARPRMGKKPRWQKPCATTTTISSPPARRTVGSLTSLDLLRDAVALSAEAADARAARVSWRIAREGRWKGGR